MSEKIIQRKAIIIPGVQKGGTTTLFELLSNHSKVDSSNIKEGQFFALEKQTIENNLFWYKNRYSNDKNKWIIDASTFYFQSRRTPHFIKTYIKKPKTIIILRDPVKRAYSGYLHMNKKIKYADKRDFKKIVKKLQGPTTESIIRSENSFLNRSIEKGYIDEEYISENYLHRYSHNIKANFEDPLWPYKYFQNSLYRFHIKGWRKVFGQIKIIFLEDLIKNTSSVMEEVVEFIGIDFESELAILPHANKTKVPKNKLARYLLYLKDLSSSFKTTKILVDNVDFNINLNETLYKSKPRLSRKLYNECRYLLKNEYQYWISKYDKLDTYWTYDK